MTRFLYIIVTVPFTFSQAVTFGLESEIFARTINMFKVSHSKYLMSFLQHIQREA